MTGRVAGADLTFNPPRRYWSAAMSDPTPSAPSFLTPTVLRHRAQTDDGQALLLTPKMMPAMTPLQTPALSAGLTPRMMPALPPLEDDAPQPALTPVRQPTRRFVVKTAVSPEAAAAVAAFEKAEAERRAAEKAAVERASRQLSELTNDGATLIGLPAPQFAADPQAGQATIIGMPAPLLPPAPLPRELATAQTIIKRPKSNPPRVRIQDMPTDPARPAPPVPVPDAHLAVTLPPNLHVAPAPLPPDTVPSDAKVPPAVNPLAATLPPNNKVAPAKPPPAPEVVALTAARRRRVVLALLAVVVIAVGASMGALIKRLVSAPAQSTIVEVAP